jgi:hypothetical protein
VNPYTRDKIENWVSDFCVSDCMRQLSPPPTPKLREHAGTVLVEFLVAACEFRGGDAEPEDLEEGDLKRALLQSVARFKLSEPARTGVPALCGAFLTQLQDEGRLGGGRAMGAYVAALHDAFLQAASGKQKPVTRPGSKIGRNDPCPCGSGRKYKSCCMRGM